MKTEKTTYLQLLYNIKLWQWISISEFILLIILIFIIIRLIKKSKRSKEEDIFESTIIKEGKSAEVNMDNVINSMFHSKNLYDSLKRKIHPDRFSNDPEKIEIANELATQLNENQKNFKKLEEIKTIAIEKLGIKF